MANPNPYLSGKNMTCLYDNTLSRDDAEEKAQFLDQLKDCT
jgi:hypothetical protein